MPAMTALALTTAASLYSQRKQAKAEDKMAKKQIAAQETLKTEEKNRANKEAEILAAKSRKKAAGGYQSTMGGSTTSFGGY